MLGKQQHTSPPRRRSEINIFLIINFYETLSYSAHKDEGDEMGEATKDAHKIIDFCIKL